MPSPPPTQLKTPSNTCLFFTSWLKPSEMKSFMKRAGCETVKIRKREIAAFASGLAVPAESTVPLRRNDVKSRNAAKPMPPTSGSRAMYDSS